ncbi:MAG: hypothetical protein QOJ60_2848, partial [Actinomycetota bacterium]|nr:hypothetical protein [Actinomycetota bacterium]
MTTADPGPEQLALLAPRARRARPRPVPAAATELPVARVAVDLSLPHLDRPFDYLVPAELGEAARPGVRVRVRFAGQQVDGFVLDRLAASEHPGRLSFLAKVVSAERVLSPEVAVLARSVADRYAGMLADVLRLAVPPRHARVEREAVRGTDEPRTDTTGARTAEHVAAGGPGPWADYDSGPALLTALRRGAAPRAVWTATPGAGWPIALAHAVAAVRAADRGALIVVPDGRDADRVGSALDELLGPGHHVVVTAELGPAERYRRWLAVSRGRARVVVGTRAAMFAPVADLGLVALWDDGDDLHAEPRAPYPHVREVLAMRAAQQGCALLVAGFARTAEGTQLVSSGWAREVRPGREVLRRAAPRVRVAGEDSDLADDSAARSARLPSIAWRTAHEGLTRGPVLVQVPRAGYLPALACVDCRAAATCSACGGPLQAGSGHAIAACRWCGRPAGDWACPSCGARSTRARSVGSRRTAEELGRAFPRVPVHSSEGDRTLAVVGPEPALVVATPGAEPVAAGGYAAALLLDGHVLLGRPDLRSAEESLRRWLAAAALVRPASEQGVVVLLADPAQPAAAALVRWDPVGFGERELAERVATRLPPAARLASLTAAAEPLRAFLEAARLPPGTELLGPVPVRRRDGEPLERLLLRVPQASARAL